VCPFFLFNPYPGRTRKKRRKEIMSDQLTIDKPTDNTAQQPAQPVPQPPEQKPEPEHMIPKSRMDELIRKNREYEERLAAQDKANKDAEEARLIKEKNFEELAQKKQEEIEKLKPLASIAEELLKTAEEQLNAQIAELPEHVRDMVPEELTTQQKLKWLAKNKAYLMKPKGPENGAGKQGGSAPETIELTTEQLSAAKRLGIKPEDYAKNL
jgi:hypothetical protein